MFKNRFVIIKHFLGVKIQLFNKITQRKGKMHCLKETFHSVVLTVSLILLPRGSAGSGELSKMTDLCMSHVFKEITSAVGCQIFSAGHFGRHCGRNVLILQHDVTLMLVFGNSDYSNSSLEFIKSVSAKGVAIKGIEIVGNENVVLLLDGAGKLWRLINAFEFSDKQDERLYLLDVNCFYEWVPFKKFNFEKVLGVTAWGCGFICVGVHRNSQKKLLLLPSVDSNIVKDLTFEELRCSSSLNFHLINFNINTKDSNSHDVKSSEEKLVIADRLSGKTYICSGDERSLINYSNGTLVCVLHFEKENCLLLCFQSGRLVPYFLNFSSKCSVVYLFKKLSLIEKCCCFASCILWSDGVSLHHTKLVFEECNVKLVHLKLKFNIQKPLWFSKFDKCIIAVTVNNIYYQIKAGSDIAEKIQRQPEELLTQMYEGSLSVHKLNTEIDAIAYFLYCKEVFNGSDLKEKVEINAEQNFLLIKFSLGVTLKKDFWRVKLMTSVSGKKHVKMAGLETDVSDGMLIKIENPFKSRVQVTLVGDFDGESLFANLGEVGESESVVSDLSKNLKQILIQRNSFRPET